MTRLPGPLPPHIAAGRGGSKWARVRQQVFDEETNCWICGRWVDQNLPRTHPMGRTVDHLVELRAGGQPVDRHNCRLAHRRCNSIRSARLRGNKRLKPQVTADLYDI